MPLKFRVGQFVRCVDPEFSSTAGRHRSSLGDRLKLGERYEIAESNPPCFVIVKGIPGVQWHEARFEPQFTPEELRSTIDSLFETIERMSDVSS